MLVRTQRLLEHARGRVVDARERVESARERVEVSERMQPLRLWLLTLSYREVVLVARICRGNRHASVRRLAFIVSWLGNGLFYLMCAGVLLWFAGAATRPVAVAAAAIGIAHIVYPWIKLACGRPRPFEIDRALAPLLPPLDQHSFPSGHAMTLTAALLPLAVAWPFAWPLVLLAWAAMAWSRIACAHHYPSDVLAGTLLGASVAMPLAVLLL
jgi:undecaprenyl-diphosphatase